MKHILATLLIVLVFGCKGKERPYEIKRTFIFGTDTLDIGNCGQLNLDKWRAGHFNGNGHNDTIDRVFYDTFKVHCHDTVFIHDTVYTSNHYGNVENLIIGPQPSPIPDTTKPLNIKMQPRWRDSVILGEGLYVYGNDSIRLGGTLSENTVIDRKKYDSLISKWTDASKATRGETFTITPVQDTSRCLLLVSDTSNQNGFRSSRCWWMEGYEVAVVRGFEVWVGYLDQSKIPLKKNIIVWLSKEVK